MTDTQTTERLITTIDAANLRSIRWYLVRQLFPRFAEEMELGRYMRNLLQSGQRTAVRIEPHRSPDGRTSDHVFDVYEVVI